MAQDDYYKTQLMARLNEFAETRQIPVSDVISLKFRLVSKGGDPILMQYSEYDDLIGVVNSKAPEVVELEDTVPFLGRKLHGAEGFPHKLKDGITLWIHHESGLEILGLVLGIIGAIQPTIDGIKWLVKRVKGKPDQDLYRTHNADFVLLEARTLLDGHLIQSVILWEVETAIDATKDDASFLKLLDNSLQSFLNSTKSRIRYY